jgi:hypothetical protein
MLKTSPASDAEVTASSPGGPRADCEVTRALENESSAPARTGEESPLESVVSDSETTTAEQRPESAARIDLRVIRWALAIVPDASSARCSNWRWNCGLSGRGRPAADQSTEARRRFVHRR